MKYKNVGFMHEKRDNFQFLSMAQREQKQSNKQHIKFFIHLYFILFTSTYLTQDEPKKKRKKYPRFFFLVLQNIWFISNCPENNFKHFFAKKQFISHSKRNFFWAIKMHRFIYRVGHQTRFFFNRKIVKKSVAKWQRSGLCFSSFLSVDSNVHSSIG